VLCAIGPSGRSSFTLLKNSLDGKTPLVYFAFDLLEQDGEDLTDLPLLERKARLERLLSKLPGKSPIRYRITSSATATKCWRRCLPAGRKASSPSGPMLVIRPASGFQLGRRSRLSSGRNSWSSAGVRHLAARTMCARYS